MIVDKFKMMEINNLNVKSSKQIVMTICQFCKVSLKSSNMKKHLTKCDKYKKEQSKLSKTPKGINNESMGYKKIVKKKPLLYTGSNILIPDEYGNVEFKGINTKPKEVKQTKILRNTDSYYNNKASDNTPFSKRDNGQFGSFPLYENDRDDEY